MTRLLEPAALLHDMRAAFRGADQAKRHQSRGAQRARAPLGEGTSATVLFPGTLPGVPAYTVKVHAKFPGQDPAIRGLVLLHDLETGALLSVMDSGHLTAVRTAAAAAVATDALARPDAERVALIGAGVQSAWALRLLPHVRQVRSVTVFDIAPLKTGPFVRRLAEETDAALVPTNSLAEAVLDADIVVCATWSREPFLYAGMVTPGTHLTTLGPDEPGPNQSAPCELSADLIQESRFVCDDRDLAVQVGALGGAGLGAEAVHAELGEVLSRQRPGREHPEQVTVYGGVGLPWMDLVAAWGVYEQAQETGAGQRVDFLA